MVREFFVLVSLVCGVGGVFAADAAKSRELVVVLQSNAELAERARACQQLAIVGTADAIPALAALLADDKLGSYARDALEVMPDAAAVDALRDSLGRLSGERLVGVINSLGVRCDAAAVPALTKLAGTANAPVSNAVFRALGRIATPPAIAFLRQSLGRATDASRDAVAEGLLIAADRVGGRDASAELYEVVRRAAVTAPQRATATRGVILARGATALALLLENLRAADEPMRDMAVRCVRELRGDEVPAALAAQWATFSTALQVMLVEAFADQGSTAAIRQIESAAANREPAVRIAALQALGRCGREASVPLLLRATGATNAAEADAAFAALGRTKLPVDAAILDALASASADSRLRFIAVLGERGTAAATPRLLVLATSDEARIRTAALRALGLVAKPRDLAAVIQLANTARSEEEQTLADRAVVTTSMKILEPEMRATPTLDAYRAATDPAVKARLLRPLGAIVRMMGGSHEAFFAVRPALDSHVPALRQAALALLADWPDAAPTSRLLAFATQSGTTPTDRTTALRGALRMAAAVAAGRERSPLNVVDAFTRASKAVQTKEEKLLLVSSLGSLRHPAALALLQPYVSDPDVQVEAALAVLQIAPALNGGQNAATLKPMLEKIAATDSDEQVRQRAARLARGGGPAAGKAIGKGKSAPVAGGLNGAEAPSTKDFSGWEGDPGVWRIRGDAIVGGSLEGNPRNEFLATKRSYRDFVLRIEYRLVGTEGFVNGGVQFRSVRIPQPPNEMSGYQADIGAGHSGCLYDESRRKKFLARATDEQIKRLEKPGEWNAYEIRCQGARIEIALNGERTVSFTEEEPGLARDGLIALQIHGNCKAEIQFRALSLQEMAGP